MKSLYWLLNNLITISDVRSSGYSTAHTLHPEKFYNLETQAMSSLFPDGTLVAHWESDGSLRVRRTIWKEHRMGDVLFTCQQVASCPIHIAWSSRQPLMAVQLADGTNHVYHIGRGRYLGAYQLDTPVHQTRALVFAPQSKAIALAKESGVVVWNDKAPRTIGTGPIQCIAWSPDESYIALGGGDAAVGVYRTTYTRKLVRQITGFTAAVSALAWSPNGKLLASGDQDGNILLWKTNGSPDTWDMLAVTLDPPMNADVAALAWSPDGKTLAAIDNEDQVDLFPLPSSHQ
jgi:WD40 repeat protein